MKKKVTAIFIFLCFCSSSFSQETNLKLNKAMENFLADPLLKHAVTGFYVMNAASGETVYKLNDEMGLAPGSTQKILTAIAAFELFGKDYTYKTDFDYTGTMSRDTLNGDIIIRGSGDPSLGSNLYPGTSPKQIFTQLADHLHDLGIRVIRGNIVVEAATPEIPGAWIWEDLGNYYGAASSGLNWRENTYDLHLRSGKKMGEPVTILSVNNDPSFFLKFDNHVISAEAGSGDQSYIYLPFHSSNFLIKGTIPVDKNDFVVHGSVKNPEAYFKYDLKKYLSNNINFIDSNSKIIDKKSDSNLKTIYTYKSPSLDSLIYFFLQKSINLYGEAFLQKMAEKENQSFSTEKGVITLQNFWERKGIEKSALNIFDGSGLSPQNRITAASLVKALQYAKSQSWYPAFYKALPEFNQIKMKSGTINSVKAFTGYIHSSNGRTYIFAFIVNNYDSHQGKITQKMYEVLNALK